MTPFKTLSLTAALAAPLALGTTAFGQLSGAVAIDGSSTVYPITEAVAEEFAKEHANVRVTVGISGTGGGFKRFAAGETDASNASRPIKWSEHKTAVENGVQYIEIPIAYDGLTVVVNKQNDWAKELSIDDLRKIFLEKDAAKSWKDVNPKFPDVEIKVFAPGTDSGTFDYFNEVVANSGKAGNFRPDMSVSEDDNVLVLGVVGNRGGIGFFGCSYYFENADKLNAVAIVNGEGKAIVPTAESIEDGSYNPLSRPLFVYVNNKSFDKPEVAAFIKFYFEAGPELAKEVGYVPLPSSVYDIAKANVKNRKTGTQFHDADGNPLHGAVTKLYKKL